MQKASPVVSVHEVNVKHRSCSSVAKGKPKLLNRLRQTLRSSHYSRRTEQAYCLWVKRFIILP